MSDLKERVSRALDLGELFNVSAGHSPRKNIRCPLPGHEDRNPSMSVDLGAGTFHCFGCNRKGSVIDAWGYLNMAGYDPDRDFGEALKQAAATYGVGDSPRRSSPRSRPYVPPPTPKPLECKEASKGYADVLDTLRKQKQDRGTNDITGTPAIEYLTGRGLPESVILDSRARYVSDSLIGPAVAFPIYLAGEDGKPGSKARGIHLRSIDPNAPGKLRTRTLHDAGAFAPGHAFLTAGEWPERLPDGLAITEAPIDALSLATCGMLAVATLGTAIPSWLPRLLFERTLYLAHDNDERGDEAAQAWADLAPVHGFKPIRVRPPRGKDWNDALLAYGAEQLAAMLPIGAYPKTCKAPDPPLRPRMKGDFCPQDATETSFIPSPHEYLDSPLYYELDETLRAADHAGNSELRGLARAFDDATMKGQGAAWFTEFGPRFRELQMLTFVNIQGDG